jgi:hypothetical protein
VEDTKGFSELDVPAKNLHYEWCWVCKEKFTDYGGKPSFFEHRHHIVPRAFGGTAGPTVSLCDSHHMAAHFTALRLEKGKPYHEKLTGEKDKDRRLLWLATIICNAKALTKDDPNKPIPIMFVAKGITKQKLKRLKAVHKLSYGNLIEVAINNLYSKSFQK